MSRCPRDVTLYHGSIRLFRDSILKDGIKESEGVGAYDGVFLSKSVQVALKWARMRPRGMHGSWDTLNRIRYMGKDPKSLLPVVFVVNIPGEETIHLTADFNVENYFDYKPGDEHYLSRDIRWDDERIKNVIYNRCKGRPIGNLARRDDQDLEKYEYEKRRHILRGNARLRQWKSWKDEHAEPSYKILECESTTIPTSWIVGVIDYKDAEGNEISPVRKR